MAVQSGLNLVVRIGEDPSDAPSADTYTVIAGIRNATLNQTDGSVDGSSQSSNGWNTEVANAGRQTVTASGDGIFEGAVDSDRLQAAYRPTGGVFYNFEIVVPNHGTYQGKFKVSSFNFTGNYEDALAFNAEFISSGVVTFAAVTRP